MIFSCGYPLAVPDSMTVFLVAFNVVVEPHLPACADQPRLLSLSQGQAPANAT